MHVVAGLHAAGVRQASAGNKHVKRISMIERRMKERSPRMRGGGQQFLISEAGRRVDLARVSCTKALSRFTAPARLEDVDHPRGNSGAMAVKSRSALAIDHANMTFFVRRFNWIRRVCTPLTVEERPRGSVCPLDAPVVGEEAGQQNALGQSSVNASRDITMTSGY